MFRIEFLKTTGHHHDNIKYYFRFLKKGLSELKKKNRSHHKSLLYMCLFSTADVQKRGGGGS